MQMPGSILVRSFLAMLVLATSVAASAAISGREMATKIVDDSQSGAKGNTPVIGHTGFMEIALETWQIAGQLSGYATSPEHNNKYEKITGNNRGLPNGKNQPE